MKYDLYDDNHHGPLDRLGLIEVVLTEQWRTFFLSPHRVVAHDPTIDGSAKPQSDLITFRRLGIQEITSNNANVGPVMTLKVTAQHRWLYNS